MRTELLIQWAIIIGYMTFIFTKGVWKVKKIGNADDYLVAGRNASWILIFATLGATVIGGGASIGAVGKTYEWGMLMVIVSSGVFMQFIFSGLVVAPQFRRWKLYTVAQYFGRRFDERSRTAAFVLSLVFSVFIIAAQMAAFGSVLSTLFPNLVDDQSMIKLAILIGGAMVVIYSTAGGLLAVIWTDIYQFVILFVGFLVTLGFIAPDLIANWGTIADKVPRDFFTATGGRGIAFMITTFFAFLLGETFGPAYITRFVIGKDIRHTKWGIAGVGFVLTFTFPFVIYFIAMYAKIHFPEIEPQQALPLTIQALHNPAHPASPCSGGLPSACRASPVSR
jgi:SSS family solute:Na+ symporter